MSDKGYEIKASVTREHSEIARRTNAMDIHLGGGRVITCREDQVDDVLRDQGFTPDAHT